MRRRTFLGSAASFAFGSILPATTSFARSRAPIRRVRPGEAGWPSPAEWRTLNEQVGGALTKPVPLWTPCEGLVPASCSAALPELHNPYYLGDQASGTQVFGYLDAWRSTPSEYAVAARATADVVAAVRFARKHNLRVVVKGGGHSYMGGSNAPDSLLIWTHPMQKIVLHDAFVPTGSSDRPVPAVSVQAGAIWMDVYDAVTTKGGRYVQGGGCATAGVAGLIQGGGFGSFSKGYGLAASSLLEAEVVKADGSVSKVNSARNPDLFWALKGGGGGSFGVVTKLTLKTHDLPEWFGGAGGTIKASSDSAFIRLIGRFVVFYADALCNPHWGEQAKIQPNNILEISLACQGLDRTQMEAVWSPFLAWVSARPENYSWTEAPYARVRPPRIWWDAVARKTAGSDAFVFDHRTGAIPTHAWWSGDQEQVSIFLHGYDSVWLPASLLAPVEQPRLTAALFKASRATSVGLHFNKGLAGASAQLRDAARDTAMNPQVADAFALAIVATGGLPPLPGFTPKPDLAAARTSARSVQLAAAALREAAPIAGGYVSESNYFNPNWRRDFWGSNYPRLKEIKDRVDKEGLFIVHHGVGSEAWSPDGFRKTGS